MAIDKFTILSAILLVRQLVIKDFGLVNMSSRLWTKFYNSQQQYNSVRRVYKVIRRKMLTMSLVTIITHICRIQSVHRKCHFVTIFFTIQSLTGNATLLPFPLQYSCYRKCHIVTIFYTTQLPI